jgi:predicted kinase
MDGWRMMPSVYVLMGLPGSGKTTWRNRFVTERAGAAHAVARDDVVEEVAVLHGITYREAWTTFSKTIDKEFRRRLTEAFTLGKDVVVDNTNLTAKARRRIFSRVPEDWVKVGVIFDVPEHWLVHRLLARVRFQPRPRGQPRHPRTINHLSAPALIWLPMGLR